MASVKEKVFALSIVLLLSSLAMATAIEVLAQQEMTPEWVVENGEHFVKLAISADGKYIAATTNNTNLLHMFHGNELQWTSSVSCVQSLVMSANGKYVAVGTKGNFYLFDRQNATPQVEYQLDYENSLVAVSANGNVTAVGATPQTPNNNRNSKLYLLEKESPGPTWNSTLLGTLESLSISGDGNYIVASTTQPGVLYLFTKEEATPLWTYNFGEHCRGSKISNNGDYIVAVGGNQTAEKDLRIYRFRRQIQTPNYMKVISELPSISGLSVSADGSIFAMSYTRSSRLILFNLELPPYGYGPGSVLNVSLPSRSVSMSMSSDGRVIIVGAVEGLFVYEYSIPQLNLVRQYAAGKPRVVDVASSANGQLVIAAIATDQNDERSAIYLFDYSKEPQAIIAEPWVRIGLLLVAMLVALATILYVFRKRCGPATTADDRTTHSLRTKKNIARRADLRRLWRSDGSLATHLIRKAP